MSRMKLVLGAAILAAACSPAWEPKIEMLSTATGYPAYPTGGRNTGKAKERREAKRRRRAKGK